MSIRVRRVDGVLVALCAARSMPKNGDLYLDDAVHHALSAKFHADLLGETGWPQHETMEREESNNPNREAWELMYGAGQLRKEGEQ